METREKSFKKVNFEIYIADRKATTCISAKFFLLRCVNSAALPLVRCYSISPPRRVASWVNYSSRRTESFSEHFASDLGLLKADALWCENKRCSDSNPWPMDPKASVLPATPRRLTCLTMLATLRRRRIDIYCFLPHVFSWKRLIRIAVSRPSIRPY